MTSTLLYRCTPLSAWISESTCATNRRACAQGMRSRKGTGPRIAVMRLEPHCPNCPGVVALRAGTRELPEVRPMAPGPGRIHKRRISHEIRAQRRACHRCGTLLRPGADYNFHNRRCSA